MRSICPFIAMSIVILLVSMQASGIHLHVNTAGSHGLSNTHLHEFDLNEHEHAGDTDVSLFEGISSIGQTPPFIAAFIFAFFALTANCDRQWALNTSILHVGHRTRWRPPLRAPPVLSS